MTSLLKTFGKATLKYGTKAGKIAKEEGVSIAMGGYDVSQQADAETVTKSVVQTGVSIAEDVLEQVAVKVAVKSAASFGGKMAAYATAGPIGWALMIAQLTLAVLDIFWNPFKNYYNKDLVQLKDTIDSSIRKQFLENGADYPLEIKPNIIPTTDPEFEEYYKLKKEYYDNNGLISSEEVVTEENMYREIGLLNREMEIGLNPLYNNINLLSGTTQNIAILVAIAATKKRAKERLSKAIDLTNYKPSNPSDKYLIWMKLNWQLLVSVSVVIIIIICSLFVLFVV